MRKQADTTARRGAHRAGWLFAWALLAGGCAWHRVEGPRVLPAPPRLGSIVGIAAADEETSLNDLGQIARLWSEWGAFDRVQFPTRAGDPVDVVGELRLRQREDLHRGSNELKAIGLGLSLGLLTPFFGPRVTEIHDVSVRCVRGDSPLGPFDHEVATSITFGIRADAKAVAKELDGEQMRRVARVVLDSVAASCGVGAAGAR